MKKHDTDKKKHGIKPAISKRDCHNLIGSHLAGAHGTIYERHTVAFADFAIRNPKSSITVSATLLYTISHLFCGVVFPLSDSFVTKRDSNEDHTYYLETFLIVQYMTAILCIFTLQFYIYIYERILKRKCIKNDESQTKDIPIDSYQSPEMNHRMVTFNAEIQKKISDASYRSIIDKFNNNIPANEEEVNPVENDKPNNILPDSTLCSTNESNTPLDINSDNTITMDNESNNPKDTITEVSPSSNTELIPQYPDPNEDINTENDDLFFPENRNNNNLIKSSDQISFNTDSIVNQRLSRYSHNSFFQNNNKRKVASICSEASEFDEGSIKSPIPFYRDTEGINLYLRLGAVGFGFGVMVHDGFKIADQFRIRNKMCHNALWTPKQLIHLIFIFVQTFFLFKYHRINFQRHKSMVRLILWHLAIINVCQWFKTVVYEINHELYEHYYKSSTENDYNSTYNDTYYSNCYNQLSFLVSPYLFPCAIEYSLISAAIFYKMLQKVGKKYEVTFWMNEKVDEQQKYSECHRSHKGLFIGLLFFMATVVGLVVFIMFQRRSATIQISILVYQFSEITLLVSSVIALIMCFIKMRVLNFRQLTEEEALDDNLLLVGLSGIFAYNMFLLISTIDTVISSKSPKLYFTTVLFMIKSSTEIIQSLLQVLFVLEASRKYSKFHIHVHKKPGRSFVTFLIISNLAMWVISIFETKRSDQHQIFNKYFQKTPWSIITHTLLPLIIFFRFHSTVCLTDIWSKSYKKRMKKRALARNY